MGFDQPSCADTLVWLVDADEVDAVALATYAGWLGPSERERHDRFVRTERRRQFVVGRALLRLAVGQLLGVAPATIALAERPGLAPRLEADGIAGFSISHSGRWVACAVSTATALGLDIERVDLSRDVAALAEHAFSQRESEWLAALPPAMRHDCFYRMWCAHEAHIKLGVAGAVDYPLGMPGLAGMLACAVPLNAAPMLAFLHVNQR